MLYYVWFPLEYIPKNKIIRFLVIFTAPDISALSLILASSILRSCYLSNDAKMQTDHAPKVIKTHY